MRSQVLKNWHAASLALLLVLAACQKTDNNGGGSRSSGGSSAGSSGSGSGGLGGSGGGSKGGSGGNAGSGAGGSSSAGGAAGANSASKGGSNGGGSGGGAAGSGGNTTSGTGGSTAAACSADVTCSGGQTCVDGKCQCPNSGQLCGGTCVSKDDLLGNPAHCGTSGCGVACPDTATCSAGACKCPDSKTACTNSCADLQSDPKNCGKCGTVCASGTCTAGVCRKVKDCFVKTVVNTPLVADFEGYDGTTTPTTWAWSFNAAAGSANAVYAGLYDSNDGTGSPLLSIAGPGNNASKYAASISNTQASKWGGQLGMWMGCVDASAYQGISFWVKGTVPNDKATLMVASEATSAPDTTGYGGGTCTSTGDTCKPASIEFPVTSTWTQVLVNWSTFKAGSANGADVKMTGNAISGLSWNASLAYKLGEGDAGYVPSPGAYNLSVDDVQFIGATACSDTLKLCGTGCVDTSSNMSNCGSCGNACTGSRTCSSGKCVCPANYTDCNGECVDTKIDAQNCGGCGKACTGVCSAGACQASSCTADMPQQGKTSTAGASITLGKYWLNNNLWGATGASGAQSIWSTCSSGNTIGWGTEWSNWTGDAGQVKSYDSAVLGWHWGWKITNTGLPVQLSAGKTITCGWTYRVQAGQTIDVAYDLFAHTQANPGTNDDPSDEIMIWLYRSGGAAPIGGTVATVNVGGTSWELHQGKNSRWNVYSYVRSSNADTGATLNISDFLKDLTGSRGLSTSKYLTSIESGAEIFLGSGRLDTDQYYCTIQ
jgi:hypothetical protein